MSFVLCVFFYSFSYRIRTTSPNSVCSLGAGSARGALSLWLSLVFPSREVLWFWLVLLVCPACPPLAAAIVWALLCPFGRATFIGWCPLEPPRWSLGGVRCRGGALLVLLFLLFDLLNDLPDPPLCSLRRGQEKSRRGRS